MRFTAIVLIAAMTPFAGLRAETGSIDQLVLRSAVQLQDDWLLSIENLETRERIWVRSQQTVAGYTVLFFDPSVEQLVLRRGEEVISLSLESAGSRPAAIASAPSTGEAVPERTAPVGWRERRAEAWGDRGDTPRPPHTAPPRPIETMTWAELEAYRRVLAEENSLLEVTEQADGSAAYIIITRLPRPWEELPEGARRRIPQEAYEARVAQRIAQSEAQLRARHPAAPPEL